MFYDVVLSKKRVGTAPNFGIHAETDALLCSLHADLGILSSDRATEFGLGFRGPVFMVTSHHPPSLQALHLHTKGDTLW